MPQLMKTSNPALGLKTFGDFPLTNDEAMTLDGTVLKTGILLLCSFVAATCAWSTYMAAQSAAAVLPLLGIGTIGGFIVALVTIFKKEWSPFTAPIYALLEGLALGSISSILEVSFPGVVIKAVALTFGVLFVMLFAYSLHIVPITNKLRMGIVAVTGAFVLFYAAGFFLSYLGGVNIAPLNGSSKLSLGLSFVVVVVAALNFILDFDFIERGARAGAPKYMEWYSAFGLMVTLVWLYLEIVRLLTKLRSRN
jgi:uncharacterized YccA/Bax inhibitor family protein